MGNLLFSPSGRIGPSEFIKGVVILIVIAILFAIPNLVGAPKALVTALGLLSIVTLWCWIVLWVKRYHDGGKSGWMCLLPIMIYLVVGTVLFGAIFGSDFMEMFQAAMNGATEDEIAELEAAFNAKSGIPVLIGSTVFSFAIAFLFNKMIKQDMHDNQYGPHGTVAEQFS